MVGFTNRASRVHNSQHYIEENDTVDKLNDAMENTVDNAVVKGAGASETGGSEGADVGELKGMNVLLVEVGRCELSFFLTREF